MGPRAKAFVMPTIFGGSAMTTLNTYVTSLRPLIVSACSGITNCFIATPPPLLDSDFLGARAAFTPTTPAIRRWPTTVPATGWRPR